MVAPVPPIYPEAISYYPGPGRIIEPFPRGESTFTELEFIRWAFDEAQSIDGAAFLTTVILGLYEPGPKPGFLLISYYCLM
jgi:hypothetical protein